jgi:hypothetical protein
MIAIYQKALINLIYGGGLIAVIKNRKNLNNECILLITIFIGGVLFHTMWEMKSRYTMPYVVMIIPIANIGIQEMAQKIKFRKIGELNEKNISNNSNVL